MKTRRWTPWALGLTALAAFGWAVAGTGRTSGTGAATGSLRHEQPRAVAAAVVHRDFIRLCQAYESAADPNPRCVYGVDCPPWGCCDRKGWDVDHTVPFDVWGQGEYVGRARLEHVPSYRLRVDDEIEFVYRLTRNETTKPYEINVGDEIRVESITDKELDRTLIVQPDGTITLRLLGQVRATKRSVTQLRDELEEAYKKFYKVPAINVTPIKVNTKLEDLRATVDSRAGVGGQRHRARVTPEGTVGLPAIGSVPAQGLTLEELAREVAERYAHEVEGIEAMPILAARAPRVVFVLGEVARPGRYSLDGPTTVMQALALAGSWNVGSNINQIVVFRRGEDWRLIATTLDLKQALLGNKPCPAHEIWVSDSDLIIVPKSKLLRTDDCIDLLFTRGVYRVFPFTASVNWTNLTAL